MASTVVLLLLQLIPSSGLSPLLMRHEVVKTRLKEMVSHSRAAPSSGDAQESSAEIAADQGVGEGEGDADTDPSPSPPGTGQNAAGEETIADVDENIAGQVPATFNAATCKASFGAAENC